MTDREKLIALMTESAHEWGCKINNYEHHLADHLIANGVVVREKGEWKPEMRYDYLSGKDYAVGHWCSKCDTYVRFKSDFCPNCGADMRKGENG